MSNSTSGKAAKDVATDVANLVTGDYFGALNESGKTIAKFHITAPMLAEYRQPAARDRGERHLLASKSMRGSTIVYSVSPTICISSPSRVKIYRVPNITG